MTALTGRRALMTGAAKGLGHSIALALARAGAEVAAAAVYLASSAYMTGSVLSLDGGWTAQ